MAGRSLPPTSPFAGDDGSADPALAAALAAHADGTGTVVEVVAALRHARVLVPVVAVEEDASESDAGETPPVDTPPVESPAVDSCEAGAFAEARHASAGVVAVAAPDGRTALPVFSSVAALAGWRDQARPMPAEGPRAAAAAVHEGWDLLVVDPGAASVVVPRPAVLALATCAPWQPAVADGTVVAAVREAVVGAVSDVTGVLAADAVPGRRAEVAVVLQVRPGLTRAGLDALLAAAGERLAARVGEVVDSRESRVRAGAGAPPGR